MKKQVKKLQNDMTRDYITRSLDNRFGTFSKATIEAIAYFMSLGDTEEQAHDKMKQLSAELRATNPGAKFDYVLGDTQPLIDAINASILPFMDAAAKLAFTNSLSTV